MSADGLKETKRLHIVHVSTVHRVDDVRIRHKECASLVRAGYKVSFVGRPKAATGPEPRDGVSTYELADFESRRDRFVKAGLIAWRQVKALKPDVVHFHDPELLPFAPFFRLLTRAVIYDVHEDVPKLIKARTWLHPSVRRVVSGAAAWGEPLLARACSGYVLVDASWKSRFAARPVAVCRNLPIANEFPPQPGKYRAQAHFVYVGDITPERGAYAAVEAVNLMGSGTRLTLAGPVADQVTLDQIHQLDTNNRTRLTGVLGRPAVRELLAEATAGLVLLASTPAYEDATATKVYEYMGAGLPLILSDTRAHRRVSVEQKCALIVPFERPEEIAHAMQRLVDENQLRHELGSAARRGFEQLDTWEDEFAKLLRLYRTLMDTHKHIV